MERAVVKVMEDTMTNDEHTKAWDLKERLIDAGIEVEATYQAASGPPLLPGDEPKREYREAYLVRVGTWLFLWTYENGKNLPVRGTRAGDKGQTVFDNYNHAFDYISAYSEGMR